VTTAIHPEDVQARLVRNLLALRRRLALDQMQTGKWTEHIEEIDEALARLGHDMKSTAASAAEGLLCAVMLPRLVSRKMREARRRSRQAAPPG
jgi:hypothetical protein